MAAQPDTKAARICPEYPSTCDHCDGPLGEDYSVFAASERNPAACWDTELTDWVVVLCKHCANDYDGD